MVSIPFALRAAVLRHLTVLEKMKHLIVLFSVVCVICTHGKPYPGIELSSIISEEQMRAIGISNLTEAQKEALRVVLIEKFLNGYEAGQKQKEEKPSADSSKPPAPENPQIIKSKIDGEFEGWEGETIFKLLNGQIWQQNEYNYHYHYAYMPSVVIYRDSSGYKMKVEGVKKTIRVTRLK